MVAQKYIVDTTMRDGDQSPGIAMNREQKLIIAKILDDAGVEQIEAGVPASDRYEADTIRQIMKNRRNAKISVWNRVNMEDIQKSAECGPDIIHICAPVSYVQIYSKLNKNKTWLVKNLSACVKYAQECGYEVTVGFEDASRADITFMVTLARKMKELGVTRIRFADTVGVLSPTRTYFAVRDIIEQTSIDVEIHAHNDLGMAVANSLAGAKAGANFIDTTILGIGERAGNCDFHKLIHAAQSIFELQTSKFDAFCAQEQIAELLSLHH
ncbi:homocitrate synthase [Marasmitruncus massiliensis]|uniref:homocitrate synthase n=1 Tax=Marasmitruncus massiliensis TaxID=1944642 RepID=UPI000C7E77F5|nr:homocitrate synthase [Marasmitruncus massiliensis]